MPENGTDVRLVVVGSIGIDTIETPARRRADALGGSASYACAAASFFTGVGMVGVVGADFPAESIALYKGFGIDLAGLRHAPGRTFRWSGVYEPDMINRRTLATELNVFADFRPDLPAAYRRAPMLLLGNISPELQLHVLEQTLQARFVMADTMDLWIATARPALDEVIARVHMLTLNDAEARLLTGEHSLRKCAAAVLERGPRYVVIKKGEHGAVLFSKTAIFIVPAYPVEEVVDPTGAGDCFAGGFMGRLSAASKITDAAVREALLFGSVTGSFGVEAFGLDGLANLAGEDIERRVGELTRMLAWQ
ncbi:MAG: sugar kinase [Lentisphaerae bacterium]|nr:sugar kinase [Lentisphaerota bacterium]